MLRKYLTKDNTSEFTPSTDYQPATKKYVDNKVMSEGSIDVVDNLTSTSTTSALSANQGKELASKINLISGTDTSQLESKLKEYVDSLISEALEGEY